MTRFEQNTVKAAITLLQRLLVQYDKVFSDGINAQLEACIRDLRKLGDV